VFTILPLTSDILALSFDIKSSPSISLNLPEKTGGSHSHGWGFGWYPDDQASAMIIKNPAAHSEQVLIDAITDWSNFRSTVFFCKIRGASKGYSHAETQPFARSFAGRDFLFMHNGDLDQNPLKSCPPTQSNLLEPLGKTDSELAFCTLLAQMQELGLRRIADIEPEVLHSWFKRFDLLGSADMYLSDGSSIVCFHGTQSPKQLYYSRIQPPDNQKRYESEAAQISLSDPRDTYRTALIVSSCPFHDSPLNKNTENDSSLNHDGALNTPYIQQSWIQMQPGQMLIIRRGAITWNSIPEGYPPKEFLQPFAIQPQAQQKTRMFMVQAQTEQAQEHVLNVRAMTQTAEGQLLGYRLFEVTHTTQYEYSEAVEHSTHVFRLQPTNDQIQEVIYSKLAISSPVEEIQYEDVFGNQLIHCVIDKPYKKLKLEAISQVKIFAAPPDDHSLSRRQTSIPLIWMPWQSQMMMPYLLPSELPESQLNELTQYAMSFVRRNDYRLLDTIADMNTSIYRDYKYVSSSTSLNTTPFEVYTSRQGVCQDFANLLICMARLLSIPARYRMGYIYTGASHANKIQSDASHAWAEVYLPYVGWRGFDPTNACTVAQDHIRVACGRNYVDATPTSGTIYKGGGTETLSVDVKVRELLN
jgi:transglutaminase-like putative cysteine protease/predicted glutamine amidotransferase